MTIDEELTHLESQLRRLKIEYEVYFSNPTKKPPTDVEWKVLSLLRKFSDGGRLTFSQRFRYNEMAQRYAIYSDLWRKKGRIREEGYRRPQDALLSVQGVRPVDGVEPEQHPYTGSVMPAQQPEPQLRRAQFAGTAAYRAVLRSRCRTRSGGEALPGAHRGQEKERRARRRQPRQFCFFRAKKDCTNPPGKQLSGGGIHG